MNFNLALICSDGRFADARALCASCSSLHPKWEESSLRLRSPGGSHQSLGDQRHQPGASNPSPSIFGLERPKISRRWARVSEMDRVYPYDANKEDHKF